MPDLSDNPVAGCLAAFVVLGTIGLLIFFLVGMISLALN